MSGHVVRGDVCTWSIFDDHVVGLQTESPTFNPQRRSCLLPDKLKRFMVADDCESRGSLDEPVEMFTRPDYSQRFALGLYRVSTLANARLAYMTTRPSWTSSAASPTGLASTTISMSLCISKYAVVADSSRLSFTLWNADASFSPHLHSEVCFVRSRNGSARVAKFLMNLALNWAMPRKDRTSDWF